MGSREDAWLSIGHVLHIIDAWIEDRISVDECLAQIKEAVSD